MKLAGITLVVALGLIRALLPTALEWMIPNLAADQNLEVAIGNIDLALLAGGITIEDLSIDGRNRPDVEDDEEPARPLVALERLHVGIDWLPFLSNRIHLTDLELEHPVIALVQRADGSFVLPELPGEESPAADSPKDAEGDSEPGWPFLLDRFELTSAEATLYSEATDAEVLRVGAAQLGLRDLRFGPDGIGLEGIHLEQPEFEVERDWLFAQASSSDSGDVESSAVDDVPATQTASEDDLQGVADSPDADRGGLPRIQLNRLGIDQAVFTVSTKEGPVALRLQFSTTEFGTAPEQVFPVDLALEVGGARLGLEGEMGLNPISFDGRLQWSDLEVPPILLLAYPKLVAWLESCDARGDLQIGFRSVATDDRPAGLSARGSSEVSSFAFGHPETGEIGVAWQSLQVDLREAFVPLEPSSDQPIRIALSRVSLTSPVATYTQPADAIDELLAALETGPIEKQDEVAASERVPSSSAAPSPVITIDTIELTDGTLRYFDRSVDPRHETRVDKLRTKIESLATAPTPGAKRIDVDGLIQSTGSFGLHGTLPGGEGELEFSLDRLDLMTYASLARRSGVRIDSGETSLDSVIVASEGRFRTKNQIVLHELGLGLDNGSEFTKRFGMSIDVALALLRDASGDISLSVPVAIDREGTGVDLAPIVTSALRTAVQGAIASPVKMLGMVVPDGAGPDSLGALPFAPGADRPGDDAGTRLAGLVDFVKDRPELALVLRGHWSDADRMPTARRILLERGDAGEDFPKVEGDGYLARRRITSALRDRAAGSPGELTADDEALLARYVAALEVSPDRLRSLAETRAEALRATLVERGAPSDALSVGVPAAAAEPSVAFELTARSQRVSSR